MFIFLLQEYKDSILHFSCHVFLVSSVLWVSLFFMSFIDFRNTGQVFCRVFLWLGLSNVFLMTRLFMSFQKEYYRGGNVYDALRTTLVIWTLITWLRQCWSGFSTVKLLFFPFTETIPHSCGKEGLGPTSRRGNICLYYLEFFCKEHLSLLPYLLIQSSIQYGPVYFILYFGLNLYYSSPEKQNL